jgi:hypothetical protein
LLRAQRGWFFRGHSALHLAFQHGNHQAVSVALGYRQRNATEIVRRVRVGAILNQEPGDSGVLFNDRWLWLRWRLFIRGLGLKLWLRDQNSLPGSLG